MRDLHQEALEVAEKIGRLRNEMRGLKRTQEEEEFIYFLGCAINRLEVHLINLRKQYHQAAMDKMENEKNAPVQ